MSKSNPVSFSGWNFATSRSSSGKWKENTSASEDGVRSHQIMHLNLLPHPHLTQWRVKVSNVSGCEENKAGQSAVSVRVGHRRGEAWGNSFPGSCTVCGHVCFHLSLSGRWEASNYVESRRHSMTSQRPHNKE